MDTFRIGDILIRWQCEDYRLRQGSYMERFRWEDAWQGDVITMSGAVAPIAHYASLPKLRQTKLYEVYDDHGETLYLYHWSYKRYAYAVWPDRLAAGRQDICLFDPDMLRQIPMDFDWFFGVCGLYKALLLRGRAVLHASYIGWNGSAILFTAPSQTGKSTQAALWAEHADARIINGDRALLGKREGVWHAFGYPSCGSSDICRNCTLPLGAVVVLEQGSENRVEQLSLSRQQRSLVAGMVVSPRAEDEIDQAFSVAESICASVPVIKLICRPDADAVAALKNYLEEAASC